MFSPNRISYGGLLAPRDALERQNARVRDLEAWLLKQPQVDMRTQDLTHGGMHLRWILVPAGVALNGATTNLDNVCVVIGEIEVTTEDGPRTLSGFNVLPATAGSKRAGRAISDTWWLTAWRTDKSTLEDIEDEMTNESAMLQTRRVGIEWARCPKLES